MKANNFDDFKEMVESQFGPDYSFDPMVLRNWSSMQALIVVTAIDEEFDVLVTHEELKSLETLESLHALVLDKIE